MRRPRPTSIPSSGAVWSPRRREAWGRRRTSFGVLVAWVGLAGVVFFFLVPYVLWLLFGRGS